MSARRFVYIPPSPEDRAAAERDLVAIFMKHGLPEEWPPHKAEGLQAKCDRILSTYMECSDIEEVPISEK